MLVILSLIIGCSFILFSLILVKSSIKDLLKLFRILRGIKISLGKSIVIEFTWYGVFPRRFKDLVISSLEVVIFLDFYKEEDLMVTSLLSRSLSVITNSLLLFFVTL